MWFWSVALLLLVLSGRLEAQNSAEYVCVDASVCPGGVPTDPGIDPRIVTPGGGGGGTSPGGTPAGLLCNVGQVACYTQGPNSNCGRQLVSPVNTGSATAQPGAWPWQAFLAVGNSYIGSGVLLNNYIVLTAAHKVSNYSGQPIRVYMGVNNPSNLAEGQSSDVDRVLIASDFNYSLLKNDIALLHLRTPIGIGVRTEINTACLPAAGQNFVNSRCFVAGWGQTAFNINDAPTQPMKQVDVPIVSLQQCRQSMSNNAVLGSYSTGLYLDDNEICAGGEAMKDACTQDGGAPLMCPGADGKYTIAGLVIWGKNCGQPGVYGVYVSVPAYVSRINAAVAALTNNPAASINL